jgi:hypothetical protein
MANGPTIIVDKSALQSLNRPEAHCLELMFNTNVVPVLFIEILADLHKPPPAGRTAEKVVADLAAKMPSPMSAYPNIYHGTLALGDLLGHAVEMSGVPVVGGGYEFRAQDGRTGIFFDEPPEAVAFRRWAKGDFQGVERDFAQAWRTALGNLDLRGIEKAVLPGAPKFRTLHDILVVADAMLDAPGKRYSMLKNALNLLGIPDPYRPAIVNRWKRAGGPPLRSFAPYASYLLRVEFFFYMAIASGLIRRVEPNHRTDIAYIFYLPFCKVFTSCDAFHRQVAPLFMRDDQVFIDGGALKPDLAALGRHFDSLPPEVRAKGSINYAAYPPLDGEFLVAEIYDRVSPGWRGDAVIPTIEITPELNEKVMKHLKPMIDAIEARHPRRRDGDN